MQKSEIFWNPKGWIEIVWAKVLLVDEYLRVGEEMISFITQAEDRGEVPNMLIDFSHLESMAPDVVVFGTNTTRDLNCAKIAGFGIQEGVKAQLDAMKFGSTKANVIREFATRADAETWLLDTVGASK